MKVKPVINTLLRFLLDRSLFWKVGFIIGLCVMANFLLSFYLYTLSLDLPTKTEAAHITYSSYEKILYLLVFFLILFLTLGAIIFWFLVKRPLDKISESLDRLIYNPESIEAENLIKVSAKDEIGDVAVKVNNLLKVFREVQIYKHLIENDESIEDIYQRLGEVIKVLGFGSFVIFEVSNSQNNMSVVYKSDEDLEVNSEKLFNADKCRAKRTAKIVSSLEAPHICKLYEYIDTTHHYCVPILSGNKVLGVVEIHLPMEEKTLTFKKFKEKLSLVNKYIEETAPVIESKRYAEALKEQTYRDPLTNLYNRRFFEGIVDNIVAQILRRGTLLGILMCDLDYFKSVNDKYGHDVGDFVLKELGQILAGNLRKSDLIVRFGGEEFLVLLLDIKEGEAERVAEKLRRAVELYDFKTPKGILKKTISIGVSEFPLDTSAIWEAIKFADIALYKAKEGGRNKVVRFKREFWTEEEY